MSENSFVPTDSEENLRQFRSVLGQFATGVTIVTTKDAAGKLLGITANSFSSVSLEPPLVLWSVGNKSQGFDAFQEAENYCINILERAQQDLAFSFSKSVDNKYDGITFEEGLGGAPVLPGSIAVFECRKFANYPGGDHVILVGEVLRCHTTEGSPLLFYKGQFKDLA